MEPTKSQFHIYSMGIAAANKHLDTDKLYVVPIEITPFGEGELDSRLDEFEGKGKDRYDEDYHVKVNHDRAIEASWLRITHTNRRTPPDVRRGERILLYRHSNSGDFYWDSMGMDDHLRRKETVVYSWSATDREDEDATSPNHSYSLEVCTHTKQVTFRTVKGIDVGGGGTDEPFAYTFQFNTADGAVILTDDVGNWFQIDSAATKITVMNKDGSYTHWDKENINMYAPNDITITADNNIEMTAGVDMTVEVGNDQTVTVGNDQTTTVGNNQTTEVGSDQKETVGNNKTVSVGSDYASDAGNSITFTCGGSTIKMTSDHIVQQSPMIDLNP